MPKAYLDGGEAFEYPPIELKQVLGERGYQYLLTLHHLIFGLQSGQGGSLDEQNVKNALAADTAGSAGTADHATLTNVLPYQHHGAGAHEDLDQAVLVADEAYSTVAITSPDATNLGTCETLANELKDDVNTLVDDVNALNDNQRAILAALAAAGLMA